MEISKILSSNIPNTSSSPCLYFTEQGDIVTYKNDGTKLLINGGGRIKDGIVISDSISEDIVGENRVIFVGDKDNIIHEGSVTKVYGLKKLEAEQILPMSDIGKICLFLIHCAYVGGAFANGIKEFDVGSTKISYDKYLPDKVNRLTDIQVASMCGVDPTSIVSLVKSVVETGIITAQQRSILYPVLQEYYDKVVTQSYYIDGSSISTGKFMYQGQAYGVNDLMLKFSYGRWGKSPNWNYDVFNHIAQESAKQGYKYVSWVSQGVLAGLHGNTNKYDVLEAYFFYFSDTQEFDLTYKRTDYPWYTSSNPLNNMYAIEIIGTGGFYGLASMTTNDALRGLCRVGTSPFYLYGGYASEFPSVFNRVNVLSTSIIDGDFVDVLVRPAIPAIGDLSVVYPSSAYGKDYIKDIVNIPSNLEILKLTTSNDIIKPNY